METTKKANISFCLKLNEFLNMITTSKWDLLFKDPSYKDFRYKEERKATEGDGRSKAPQLRGTDILKETSWCPGITMYSPFPVTENQCAVLETNTGNQTLQLIKPERAARWGWKEPPERKDLSSTHRDQCFHILVTTTSGSFFLFNVYNF